MEKSKVYYTNLRTKPGMSLLKKLRNLIKAAGIENINFENQYTAIKLHFGEPGNMAYIRPNYVATVVDLLNSLGAKTFLTDANTLYSGKNGAIAINSSSGDSVSARNVIHKEAAAPQNALTPGHTSYGMPSASSSSNCSRTAP